MNATEEEEEEEEVAAGDVTAEEDDSATKNNPTFWTHQTDVLQIDGTTQANRRQRIHNLVALLVKNSCFIDRHSKRTLSGYLSTPLR